MDLMLKEIIRVMKPGGYLFIREHDVHPADTKLKDKLDQMHLEWDDYQMYVKETRLRLKKDDSFLPKINYMSRDGLRDMLKAHGLSFIGDRDYRDVVPVRKVQKYNYNFNYGTNWQHLYHALFKFTSDTKETTT
jgi:ubiquinone/menaquinone biosynthesis C-methylase UbiE